MYLLTQRGVYQLDSPLSRNPSKIHIFLEKGLRIFFLIFVATQIINRRPIRGRPLMIWGGRGKFEIFFFLEKGVLNFFSLDFLRPPPRSLMVVSIRNYHAAFPEMLQQIFSCARKANPCHMQRVSVIALKANSCLLNRALTPAICPQTDICYIALCSINCKF